MTTTSSPPIELSYRNEGGRVRVVPPDHDIMVLPTRVAIDACRAFNKQLEFQNQFADLLDYLADWISKHRHYIKKACVTTRDAGLLFLVVSHQAQYCESLEDALTTLDMDVAAKPDFNLIQLSVHAIPDVPDESVESFLSSNLVLRYRMDGE